MTETTPPIEIRMVGPLLFAGQCKHCGWRTERVSTAGQVSALAAIHGRVLPGHEDSAIPACEETT